MFKIILKKEYIYKGTETSFLKIFQKQWHHNVNQQVLN